MVKKDSKLQAQERKPTTDHQDIPIRDTEIREARQAVLDTTQQLNLVLDYTKTGFWNWNLITDKVTVNNHWRTIFSLTEEPAIDVQKILDRVHAEDIARITRAIEQAISNNQFYNEDFRIVNDNGTITHVNGQGNVIRDEQGTPVKMLGTNVDITDKKQREEQLRLSEERLTMAVSGTFDGIYDYYNTETGESWWSPRVYELLGLQVGEMEANVANFATLVHPRDQHLSERARQDFINHGKPFDIEFRVKHKTKGYRWFRSRANIVQDEQGKVTRMVGAFADVHDQKTYELTLKETNRKLRVANQYLDNFVFMAAHDLRSPVANLKSLTHLWHSGYQNPNLIIDKVNRSVARLDDTLNGLIQILDVQQYEHKQISELYFATICQKLRAEMASDIEAAQAHIQTDFAEAGLCYIEPFLESILRNLLSNALKYCSPKRPAEIALTTRRENGFVVLQVEDNGIGIDLKRDRDKIFKAFERLTRHGEGQGIGMHLIKNMVEKNQGFIEVESELDQGTTFKVYLKPYEGN